MIKDYIKRAINTGATIEIEYDNNNGISSQRRLSNICYSEKYGCSYISAFCHVRQDERTFKIERIKSISFINEIKTENIKSKFTPNTSDSTKDYVFNENKKIYNLFGIDYNH